MAKWENLDNAGNAIVSYLDKNINTSEQEIAQNLNMPINTVKRLIKNMGL